ncbi:acyl carrier protein [Constrictibacter sp. MBR-5]|jgi:acyl carrier protein|uniref:acyl carrier protein n=1 Tax=Constrictibacter sp. MBR-5 TaxID=3156467 RepID=UPI003393A2DA
MTEKELEQIVLEALSGVAPELDTAEVGPRTDLRNDLDLDSMDFLNFVIGLSQRLQVDIPEADYPKLRTLSECVAYLQGKGVG